MLSEHEYLGPALPISASIRCPIRKFRNLKEIIKNVDIDKAVLYSCDDERILFGNDIRECLESVAWLDQVKDCQGKCSE